MTAHRWTILGLTVLFGCDDTGVPGPEPEVLYGDCEANEALRESLRQFDVPLDRFELFEFDTERLRDAMAEGRPVTLPIMTAEGGISQVELDPRPMPGFEPMGSAHIKGSNGELGQVQIETNLNFQLGCEASDLPCGAFSVLDGASVAPGQFEATIVDPLEGWVVIESVGSLLENLGAEEIPEDKCGVVYNSAFHGAIQFDDLPAGEDEAPLGSGAVAGASWVIPIVLDADQTFYNQDPETAWARQRSVLTSVNLMYHLIEPLSTGSFDILFALKAQEAWTEVFSGPDEVLRYDLLDRINDPSYPMITHPENDEVSYFFVGYDLIGGIAGVAGGICNVDGYDDTFGSDAPHQNNHAWGQQVADRDGGYAFSTFYGRSVVAAHEIGHMVGATHRDGLASDCAGGGMPGLCGSSLMRSGAAGGVAPDFRQPFFTDANDANIVGCVGDAVP